MAASVVLEVASTAASEATSSGRVLPQARAVAAQAVRERRSVRAVGGRGRGMGSV
jgi:hypothetical protein